MLGLSRTVHSGRCSLGFCFGRGWFTTEGTGGAGKATIAAGESEIRKFRIARHGVQAARD